MYGYKHEVINGIHWVKTDHGSFPGASKTEAKDRANDAANAAMRRLWRTRQWETLVRRGAVR